MEFEEVSLAKEDDETTRNAKQTESSSAVVASRFVSDTIKVQINPEKKGNFLKHTAYNIRSENNNCTVERRYNDFLILHEKLLKVYEYRAVPRLPPKQFMLDEFLEERRAGLQRWLTIVAQHVLISKDAMLKHFLTDANLALPDTSSEFFDFITKRIQALKLYELDKVYEMQNAARFILNNLLALKRLMNDDLKRQKSQGQGFLQISSVLTDLMESIDTDNLKDFVENFNKVYEVTENSKNAGAIEQLEIIIEVLIGYNDACTRLLSLKEMPTNDNGQRLKSLLMLGQSNDENSDTRQRRILFGTYCVHEEFKMVKNYLRLLPTILLKFTYQQSQLLSEISAILKTVLDLESDKLN